MTRPTDTLPQAASARSPSGAGGGQSLPVAIVDLLADQRRALHVNEIAARLQAEVSSVREALAALVDAGSVVPHSGQRYRAARGAGRGRGKQVIGAIHIHARGFGFVRASGLDDDLYVDADAVRGALHGDTVRARVVARSSKGFEGEVVEVLQRGRRRVVGVVRGRGRWLQPDDTRLRPVDLEGTGDGIGHDADDDAAAVAEITRYPEQARESPVGRLVAVLGTPGDPDVEVAKILIEHGIDEAHDEAAVAEAEALARTPDENDCAGREDLTDVPLVTIDPADARDLDDALWAEHTEAGGYRVVIAVADVSHYVRQGTALDRQALARGNSVYLPDRAVPMLPPALSSRICSLLAGQTRLCMAVCLTLDPTGVVRRARLVEGVMRSRAQLSYASVARTLGLTTEPPRSPEAEAHEETLQTLWGLSSVLRARRMRRGALGFDLPEAQIVLDEDSRMPVHIGERGADPGVRKAYRLVEELMLLANETVAKHFGRAELPCIYRVHGAPDHEKLERFVAVARTLGVQCDLEDAETPRKLSRLVRKIDGHPKHEVLHMLLLRAMQQACYQTENIGHFGLASDAYVHFTSPIRRYADLEVHRVLRAALRDASAVQADAEATNERLAVAAATASEQERNAVDVERQVGDLYRALLMSSRIGDELDTLVTGMTSGGVYCRAANPFVDVFVPADDLGNDRFELDDLGIRLVGVRSGMQVQLGDPLTVRIVDASITRRMVFGRRVGHVAVPPEAERPRKGKRKQRAVTQRRATTPKRRGGGRKR